MYCQVWERYFKDIYVTIIMERRNIVKLWNLFFTLTNNQSFVIIILVKRSLVTDGFWE